MFVVYFSYLCCKTIFTITNLVAKNLTTKKKFKTLKIKQEKKNTKTIEKPKIEPEYSQRQKELKINKNKPPR